jgi:hypothetical protein
MRPSPYIASGTSGSSAPLVALVAALVAALGCASAPDLTPRPARLTPGGGAASVAATVTITGEGFFPRVVQSASGGLSSLDTTHHAWLDTVELADVTWVDARTLRATIPAGLALGPHALTVENALGRRGTLAAAWTVIQPAVLTLSAAITPAQASVGQPLALTVTADNSGGAAVLGLTVTVTPSGAGAVAGALSATAFDLGPRGSHQVVLALTASSPGAVLLGVSAQGLEEASGRTVTASAADPPLLVQARAELTAALAIPSTIAVGATFPVTMLVENTGQATAVAVAPGPLAAVPGVTGAALLLSGPAPASADIPGGALATYTWSYRLTTTGTVRLRGGAAGLDANDGGPVVAAPSDSNLGGQLPEVAPVAVDPLGDGTPVAALAVRAGKLYVGPSRNGSGFWRLDPTSGSSSLGVSIAVDDGASKAANSAWRASPPATTFGTPGCAPYSTACGPNNEDGRGLLASGLFSGDEWLLYGASAPQKGDFVYLSRQDGPSIPFSAVDLSTVLATTSIAPTAVAFASSATAGADRVYLAFADQESKKSPRLVVLATAPSGPVLDAATPGDALDLAIDTMPGLGGNASLLPNPDSQPRLEAMAWFRDRLYLACGGTVMRSTVAMPRPYLTAPADWTSALPIALPWLGRRGLPASRSANLTPADRAVPGMAAFGTCGTGPCLFLARNVQGTAPAVVPQLWKCDPTQGGDATACDPFDWSLAAPNATGDQALTQLGDPNNGAIGLLLATQRYLYLGFDNAVTGLQLFRTEVVPATLGAFRGRDGCVAGATGCQGLGGNGFGAPAVTRLFGAAALTSVGSTTVYVAAGDATGPLRLYALPE